MDWDPYHSPPPKKPKVLLAVKDPVIAYKLRVATGTNDFHICAPDCNVYAAEFDILVMGFEPLSTDERLWYHTELLPKLNADGQIFWGN